MLYFLFLSTVHSVVSMMKLIVQYELKLLRVVATLATYTPLAIEKQLKQI